MHNQLNQFSFEVNVATVILAYFGHYSKKNYFGVVPLPKGVLEKVIQNLLVRSNFVLRFTFPDFYSLRPLGDWAPFLRHPV
jgi:hypothetical protein